MGITERYFDIIKNIEKHIKQLYISSNKRNFNIIENIGKHIEQLRPWFPSQAIVGMVNILYRLF